MQKKFSANLLLKIVVDFKQNDKSEFASASEPIFEPRKGRKIIARGGTAKPWNPGEA